MTQEEFLALSEGATRLEGDRHGAKVLALPDGTIIKLFRRKRVLTSDALFPYASRFARNAEKLRSLGIPVPTVIAVARIAGMARDMVQYRPLPGQTLRELVKQGLTAGRLQELKDKFNRFVIKLHDNGVYFRSLHLGNVVLTPDDSLGLIDFSDLRVYPWRLGPYLRARNMRRLQGIRGESDWFDLAVVAAAHDKKCRRDRS